MEIGGPKLLGSPPIVTILDLTDVNMTIFLPAADAGGRRSATRPALSVRPSNSRATLKQASRSCGPISRRAEGSGMSARDNLDQSLVGGERHAEWSTRSYSSTASPIVAKKDPSPI
jgi:hypothetical protein